MKLVTVEIPSPNGTLQRLGALETDGSVIDLNVAYALLVHDRQTPVGGPEPLAQDLLGLIRAGPAALDAARQAVEAASSLPDRDVNGTVLRSRPGTYHLRPPLVRPPSLRDFLLVEAHVRNATRQPPPDEWYRLPVYYKGNVDAIIGPDDEVPWPCYTERLDYELEVCAVVGAPAFRVSAHQANAGIFGYTIFNDWSARDIQRREMSLGLGPALGKDFANSIGPCIVTGDEFDVEGAELRAKVNGQLWSQGNLRGMQFSFPEVIEWLSLEQHLQPGDLLGSGTIGGGSGVELDRWIQPGDVVELEVDGIGVLRNRVGSRPPGGVVLGPQSMHEVAD